MKIIKLGLISIIVFFGLLMAVTAIMPSSVRISRAVDIHASTEEIKANIADLKGWQQWNEYVRALTDKQISTGEINSHEIKIVLTEATDTMIKTQWMQSSGKIYTGVFNIIPMDTITTIQWYFDIPVKWYPWEKLGSIIYDKQIGPVMQASLQNLKELSE